MGCNCMLGGKTQKRKNIKKKSRKIKSKNKRSLRKTKSKKRVRFAKIKQAEKRVIDDVYRYKVNLERLQRKD